MSLLLLVLGLMLIGSSFALFNVKKLGYSAMETVRGTVVSLVECKEEAIRWTYKPRIQFRINGNVKSELVGVCSSKYVSPKAGEKVSILFDPQGQTRTTINNFSQKYNLNIIMWVSGGALILMFFFFFYIDYLELRRFSMSS